MTRPFASVILTAFTLLLSYGPARAVMVFVSASEELSSINEKIEDLSAGDSLVFRPGVYKGPFIVKGIHGAPNQPIVLMGISDISGLTTIDGQSQPGTGLKNNAFQMESCSWIVLEGFSIRRCWTDIITSINVSYLSVKQCDVKGGKRLLYATGRQSHHFLIENCMWEQDTRVWTHKEGYSWEELHHGRFAHFNGSIFQGAGISGVFVLRNNQIKNTFNAFRLSPVGDGRVDPLASSNGDIYNNLIINTSDNVLEPEVYCHNLYFYHNRMVNGHAFISVTGVGGGPIYLYGNTGLSEPDCEDGWAIYKISSRERTMSKPFYIFNNSWYVDYNITGQRMGWWNDHVVHFNNAYFFEGVDTFGIHSSGDHSYYNFDCSSAVFPEYMIEQGFESNGIESDPLFKDPLGNDFRLKENSPCLDKGQLYEDLITHFTGPAPDIGAYDGKELIMGPAFKFSEPEAEIPFIKHPRITRYRIDGEILILWFSIAMDPEAVIRCNPVLRSDGSSASASFDAVEDEGHCLRFELARGMDPESEPVLVLSHWPAGKNGMKLTSWASALRVVLAEQE